MDNSHKHQAAFTAREYMTKLIFAIQKHTKSPVLRWKNKNLKTAVDDLTTELAFDPIQFRRNRNNNTQPHGYS